MKKYFLLFLMCIGIEAGAQTLVFYNLEIASPLKAGQARFTVQHRFNGPLDEKPFETFLGLEAGASVGLGFMAGLGKSIELGVDYRFHSRSGIWRVGWSPLLKGWTPWVELGRFSYKSGPDARESGLLAGVGFITPAALQRFVGAVMLRYDSHRKAMGLGAGLQINISRQLALLGEYIPAVEAPLYRDEASFSFGVVLRTYGHHFHLMVGNATAIGQRQAMLGSVDRKLRVGFSIHRLLEFN